MSAAARAGARGRQLISADEVRPRGLTIAFEADAEERAALARRLDLMALEALSAQLRFEAADEGEGAIRVTGTSGRDWFRAASCARARAPLVNESISPSTHPCLPNSPRKRSRCWQGHEAEPLPEDGIDVGEVVAEHLALLLDPIAPTRCAGPDPLTYSAGDRWAEKTTRPDERRWDPVASLAN